MKMPTPVFQLRGDQSPAPVANSGMHEDAQIGDSGMPPDQLQALESKMKQMVDDLRSELLAQINRSRPADAPKATANSDEETGAAELEKPAQETTIANMQEELNEMVEVVFEESVWDSSTFVFMSGIGIDQSLLTLFCFLCNTFIQMLTCIVLGYYLVENPLSSDKIEGLERWRTSEGHSFRTTDPLNLHSLVSRVCGQDYGLSIATSQRDLYEDMDMYTTKFMGAAAGGWLCVVAMAIFAMYIAVEMRKTVNYILAICTIPRGPMTLVKRTDAGSLRLCAITPVRLGWCGVIAIIRVTVAAALLIPGSLWLCYTMKMETLMLNASALGFVLDIDETIFALASPLRIAGLLRTLDPIPLRRTKLVSCAPAICIICLIAFVGIMSAGRIESLKNDMEKAMDTICGKTNWLDFQFAVDPLGGIMYSNTIPFPSTSLSNEIQAHHTVVRDLIMAQTYETAKQTVSAAYPRTHNEVKLWATFDQAQYVEYASACQDETNKHIGSWLFGITNEASYNEASFATCKQVASLTPSLCEDSSKIGLNVRWMCPVTCGCASPKGGLLYFATADLGCPMKECQTKNDWKRMRSETDQLVDSTYEELKVDEGFLRLVRILRRGQLGNNSLAKLLGTPATMVNKTSVDNFESLGCAGIQQLMDRGVGGLDVQIICQTGKSGYSGGGGAAMMCPKACCHSTTEHQWMGCPLYRRALTNQNPGPSPNPATSVNTTLDGR